MEIQKDHFVNRAKQALEKRVKVQGGQPYVGQYLNKVLVSASDEAKQMGDEYVSVEHLFLAMIKNPNKEIAEMIGDETIHQTTFGESHGQSPSGSKNMQIQGRKLIDPAEIGKMSRKDAILLIAGTDPLKDEKYPVESLSLIHISEPTRRS